LRHLLHETEQAQNLNKNPFYLEEAAYLSRGQLLYNINLLFFQRRDVVNHVECTPRVILMYANATQVIKETAITALVSSKKYHVTMIV